MDCKLLLNHVAKEWPRSSGDLSDISSVDYCQEVNQDAKCSHQWQLTLGVVCVANSIVYEIEP